MSLDFEGIPDYEERAKAKLRAIKLKEEALEVWSRQMRLTLISSSSDDWSDTIEKKLIKEKSIVRLIVWTLSAVELTSLLGALDEDATMKLALNELYLHIDESPSFFDKEWKAKYVPILHDLHKNLK